MPHDVSLHQIIKVSKPNCVHMPKQHLQHEQGSLHHQWQKGLKTSSNRAEDNPLNRQYEPQSSQEYRLNHNQLSSDPQKSRRWSNIDKSAQTQALEAS